MCWVGNVFVLVERKFWKFSTENAADDNDKEDIIEENFTLLLKERNLKNEENRNTKNKKL